MGNNLRASFDAYFNRVVAGLGHTGKKGSRRSHLTLLVNLKELVNELEKLPEFERLNLNVEETWDPKTDGRDLRLTSLFKHFIQTFFRRSKIYIDIYNRREISADTAFGRLVGAFQQRRIDRRYIAPIEGLEFKETDIDFAGCKLRKIPEDEINEIFQTEINETFYPRAKVEAKKLASLYCLDVTSRREIDVGGAYFLEGFDFDLGGRLRPKFTAFPPALERPLLNLVLYDWQGGRSGKRVIRNQAHADSWPRFTIPCIFEVDNSLLTLPPFVPEIPNIESLVFNTGDNLDASRNHDIASTAGGIQDFMTFAGEIDGILNRLQKKPKKWTFIDVALGFLLKGFFADGLEQLLWHITAIDSLLGENKENLTKLLSRRVGEILGSTPEEAGKTKDKFEDLYNFRSKLVHGDRELLPITKADAGHLQEARIMAREILVWFLRFLDLIQVEFKNSRSTLGLPERSEILRVIDLDTGSTARFKKLLEVLPDGFPHVEDWPKQNSNMTTEVNCV